MKHQHNKGKIQDNAIKALVRSNLFRYRTEKPKKGKGSYNRQAMKKATITGGFYFVIKNSFDNNCVVKCSLKYYLKLFLCGLDFLRLIVVKL